MRRLIGFAVLLLGGCNRPPPGGSSEREYRFGHLETTGLTSGIFIPGSSRQLGQPEGYPDVYIVFSKDSDRDAVRSLEFLDYKVLHQNAPAEREGGGIELVGVLNSKVRHTPNKPGMAESEPYQEFRLLRWCLHAPFMRLRRIQTPADDDWPGAQQDERLRPEDFGNKISGDLSRFICAR